MVLFGAGGATQQVWTCPGKIHKGELVCLCKLGYVGFCQLLLFFKETFITFICAYVIAPWRMPEASWQDFIVCSHYVCLGHQT